MSDQCADYSDLPDWCRPGRQAWASARGTQLHDTGTEVEIVRMTKRDVVCWAFNANNEKVEYRFRRDGLNTTRHGPWHTYYVLVAWDSEDAKRCRRNHRRAVIQSRIERISGAIVKLTREGKYGEARNEAHRIVDTLERAHSFIQEDE